MKPVVQIDVPKKADPAIVAALKECAKALGGKIVQRREAPPGAYALTLHVPPEPPKE